MRNIIGFSLMFSGIVVGVYSFIVLELSLFGLYPGLNGYKLFLGMLIYGILGCLISWKIWWTHKE